MQQFDIQSTGQYARKSQAFSPAYYNGSPATWIGRLSCWSDLRCALYPARSSTVTLKPPHTMKTTVFFALPTLCGPNTRFARAGLYAGVMAVAHESSTRIFCSSVIDIEYSTDETRQICKTDAPANSIAACIASSSRTETGITPPGCARATFSAPKETARAPSVLALLVIPSSRASRGPSTSGCVSVTPDGSVWLGYVLRTCEW